MNLRTMVLQMPYVRRNDTVQPTIASHLCVAPLDMLQLSEADSREATAVLQGTGKRVLILSSLFNRFYSEPGTLLLVGLN